MFFPNKGEYFQFAPNIYIGRRHGKYSDLAYRTWMPSCKFTAAMSMNENG